MKGYLASKFPSDKGEYTDLQVCKSAAGYYIGTMFIHNENSSCPGLVEPGSRESEYFSSYNETEEALNNKHWVQRLNP